MAKDVYNKSRLDDQSNRIMSDVLSDAVYEYTISERTIYILAAALGVLIPVFIYVFIYQWGSVI